MNKPTMLVASREEFDHRLLLLHNENWSIRKLATHFGVSRNTIRRVLRAHAARRDKGPDGIVAKFKRASKLDSFVQPIKDILEKYPKISVQRIHEKLQEAGYAGGISILREQVVKLRPREKYPVIRFETGPGIQGQMDWSPYTIPFLRTGKSTVQCFSYVLGFSRRQYIDFSLRHDFHTLIRRHQEAFEYFSGVPLECLYDNEKTVVLRWEAGRPVYNPAFSRFITHYNCKPVACRPRTPQTKGKVERPFQYVEGNFLGGRDFQDMVDLRAAGRRWLAEKSDLHIHDTTRQAPLERFALERLQPLPLHPFDTCEVALRVCRVNGLVEFETNGYSVPSGNLADILTLKASEYEILIYNPELALVARHERQSAGCGIRVENADHFKPRKDRYGLEPVRDAFLALGESADEFLRGLTLKHPKNCGAHARQILRLKEDYQADDIYNAILHALRYLAFEAAAVERILKARAAPRTLESIRNERAGRVLEQTLPKITQRPLAEYAALLNQEKEHEGQDRTGTEPGADSETPEDPEADGD